MTNEFKSARGANLGNRDKAPQKGKLNLIFFMDGAKTRHIRIPFASVISALVLLGLFVAWSIMSSYWITSLFERNQKLESRLKETLRTLLSYEISNSQKTGDIALDSKNEATKAAQINESDKNLSAPNAKGAPSESDPSKSEDNNTLTPSKPQISRDHVPKNSGDNTPNKSAGLAQSAQNSPQNDVSQNAKYTTIATPFQNQGVSIERVELKEDSDGIQLGFNLKNLDDKDKQSGYVNIIIKYQTKSGPIYKSIPSNLVVSATGEISEFYKGDTFSLKRFVRRNYTLPVPDNGALRVDEVKILLITEEGDKFTQIIPGFTLKNKNYGLSH